MRTILSERPEYSACPAETALEEFALGRLEAPQAEAVAAHVKVCAACRRFVDDMRAEGELLTGALSACPPADVAACLDDEMLAQYLDRSLSPEDREEAEKHLAACRRCQARLVALHRELKAVRAAEACEEAPGEAARYRHDEPVGPDDAAARRDRAPKVAEAVEAPAPPSPFEERFRWLGSGVLALGVLVAGGCSLWPKALGEIPGRVAAAALIAGGLGLAARRRGRERLNRPRRDAASVRYSGFLLAFSCLAGFAGAVGAPLGGLWWALACAAFGLWVIEIAAPRGVEMNSEIPESREAADEDESLKERYM